MTPAQFKEKGCYTCGSFNLCEPVIPREDLSPTATAKSVAFDPDKILQGAPIREPYLLCMDCMSEYPFSTIELLDDEGWQYGWDSRHNGREIQTVYYKSEAQFDPQALKRGFLTKEEEDVERPG